MFGSSTRSQCCVARRLLIALPVAVLVIVTGTGATLPNYPAPSPTRAGYPNVASPTITDMENQEAEGFQYDITGYVTDPGNNVGKLMVMFGGAVGLPDGQTSVLLPVYPINGSTTDGYFTVSVQLMPNTSTFPVTCDWAAVVSDGNGRMSAPVSCEITLLPVPGLP